MTEIIYSNLTASISDLKKDPMGVIKRSKGEPLAILNHNHPVFYCVPAATYAFFMDEFENQELARIVEQRSHEQEVPVNIDDL